MSFWRKLFGGDRDAGEPVASTAPAQSDASAGNATAVPDEPGESLRDIAISALQNGDLDAAESTFVRHLEHDPNDAESAELLGNVYGQRGELENARRYLELAVELDPSLPGAHMGLGNLLMLAGDAQRAVLAYEKAVRLAPDNALMQSNLANALRQCGRAEDARKAAQAAVSLAPEFAPALNNLGDALLALGRPDEALNAFDRALEIAPEFLDVINNRGNALRQLGRTQEAQQAYHRALELNPTFDKAHRNLATAYQGEGDIALAWHHYDLAYAANPLPSIKLRRALALPAIYRSVQHIDETRAELHQQLDELMAAPGSIRDPLNEVGAPNFYLAYHGRNDRALQSKTADVLLEASPELGFVAPHIGKPRRAGRLRVAFVSSFLHDHTIGHLMRGIITGLSAERFEVTVARFPQAADAMAQRIAAGVEHVVELPANLEEARHRLAGCELDVLYFPDIGMHASTYYLAFARLAPVQCMCWGHPMTSGVPNVDYFTSSVDLEPADADEHYREKLVRLPKLSFYYDRPIIPAQWKPRSDFGLRERSTVYLCPQSLFKLHPDFDAVMHGILSGDPNGCIALIAQHSDHYVKALRERWAETLGALAGRIQFVPRQSAADYLHLCAAADVILDPLHFSGGRTTAEILATGTPIVTLRGEQMRSWVTYAIYRQIDVEDCIASSVADYIAIALALGTNADHRAQVEKVILERVDGLYDNRDTVTQLETFFESVIVR